MTLHIWIADIDDVAPDQRFFAETLRDKLTNALGLPCQIEDVLTTFYKPAARTALRSGLSTLQAWLPQLWGFLYQQDALTRRAGEGITAALDQDAYDRYLQTHKPSLILALHPLAALPTVAHKRAFYLDKSNADQPPLLAALLPQYHAHSAWLHPGINHFFTAAEEVTKGLVTGGISTARCSATGLPLPFDDQPPPLRADLLTAFQLEANIPAVLVLAHQLPREEIRPLIFQLSLLQTDVQWMFDFAEDDELAALLRAAAEETGLPARMFGKQSEMQAFYTVASIVLCRPTPRTSAAILSCHTPLLLWPPRPGPEAEDAANLTEMGVALVLPSPEQASASLEGLLQPGSSAETPRLASLRKRAAHTTPPATTLEFIAKQLRDLLDRQAAHFADEEASFASQYQTLRKVHQPQEDTATPKAPLQLLPAQATPFEEIGQQQWDNPPPIVDAASWKEVYAAILMGEKQLQRQLESLDEQISTWDERQDLAQRHDQAQLLKEASQKLEQLESRRQRLQKEWRQLQDEKQVLQDQRHKHQGSNPIPAQRPGPLSLPRNAPAAPEKSAQTPSSEQQFQDLALNDELEQLKKRMRLNKATLDTSRLKDEDS